MAKSHYELAVYAKRAGELPGQSPFDFMASQCVGFMPAAAINEDSSDDSDGETGNLCPINKQLDAFVKINAFPVPLPHLDEPALDPRLNNVVHAKKRTKRSLHDPEQADDEQCLVCGNDLSTAGDADDESIEEKPKKSKDKKDKKKKDDKEKKERKEKKSKKKA